MSVTPVSFFGLLLLPVVAIVFLAVATGVVLWIVSIARHGWRTRDTLLLVVPVAVIVMGLLTFVGSMWYYPDVEHASVEYSDGHNGRTVSVQIASSSSDNSSVPALESQPINAWPDLTDPSWIGTPVMSTEQAVELVARAMLDGISSTKQGRPATMVSSDDIAFRDQVIARVRVLEPAWTVIATEVDRERMDAKVPLYSVALRVSLPQSWQVAHAAPKSGTVTAHIANGQERGERTFAVQSTPWLLDLQDFRQKQRGRQWVVARSSSTCPTEAQARQEMVDDAMRQLDALPSSRAMTSRDRDASNSPDAREFLRKRLMDRDVSLVTDQIVQTIERPYGTIYRAAMLVDAEEVGKVTPVKVTSAVPTVTPRVVDRPLERPRLYTSSWVPSNSLFAFLTMALGVLFASWLMNLVARGYFQVRIIVAAALLATLALMFVS